MDQFINRRHFALTATFAGLATSIGSASAQERPKNATAFLARIDSIEETKDKEGKIFTIAVFQLVSHIGGPDIGKPGARGQRHVTVQEGPAPKAAVVGTTSVLSADASVFEKTLFTGDLDPAREDPVAYCCIPIIIIILSGHPPSPAPPPSPGDDGGEGTDTDKDEDSDVDDDADTDGFMVWSSF